MKKTIRLLLSVAALAFFAGFWAACSVDFDPTTDDYKFSCVTDQDCVSTHACSGGVCTRRTAVADCTDIDGDGFGVGEELGDCPKCRDEGRCEEDCNDNDETVAPDLLDTCDGKDNNCNDEIDEVITCEDSFDCPDEQPYIPSCEDDGSGQKVCTYKPPNQLGGAGCADPVMCVDSERASPGEQCF